MDNKSITGSELTVRDAVTGVEWTYCISPSGIVSTIGVVILVVLEIYRQIRYTRKH